MSEKSGAALNWVSDLGADVSDVVTTSIIRYQNLAQVDTVAGATVSRMAIIAAVNNALNQ